MKVDFIETGNPDCPILRIYGDEIQDYNVLIQGLNKLITGELVTIEITALNNFESGIRLYFTCSNTNRGVFLKSSNCFSCELTCLSWIEISEKITAIKNQSYSYNWLNETSDISLLISKNGRF